MRHVYFFTRPKAPSRVAFDVALFTNLYNLHRRHLDTSMITMSSPIEPTLTGKERQDFKIFVRAAKSFMKKQINTPFMFGILHEDPLTKKGIA